MQIKIRTADERWTAKHAQRIEDGCAVVTIPDAATEQVTFAKVPLVRFDLRIVGKRLPRDWANPWTMLPAAYVVSA